MGKVVCVTGASGYVASWLVKLLLDRGYTVKGTVRNLSDPSKVAHLKALEGAVERLQLYEADLDDEGSFDSAVDGCEGVFHTASPVSVFATGSSDPKKAVETAVNGTLNVLKSCNKVSSVKRVVVTSSMVTAITNFAALKDGALVDETWFADPKFLEENNGWYNLSKVLAEKAALKFGEEKGVDVVIVNPGVVIGPQMQSTPTVSSQFLMSIIKPGEAPAYGMGFPWSDVRDTGIAHILAFENPSATGRHCLVAKVAYASNARDIVTRAFPSLNLSPSNAENEVGEAPYKVSQNKAKSLGLNFTPFEVSLKDTVECLKDKNFITF